MEKQLSEKLPRVEVVDALRGFVVMAILLVHSLEHFIFPVYPVDQPAWLNILNDGVFNVTFTLLAGKSYAIFALLFWIYILYQSANQQRKGKDFGYRFSVAFAVIGSFCYAECSFFSGRRCAVAVLGSGNRYCLWCASGVTVPYLLRLFCFYCSPLSGIII